MFIDSKTEMKKKKTKINFKVVEIFAFFILSFHFFTERLSHTLNWEGMDVCLCWNAIVDTFQHCQFEMFRQTGIMFMSINIQKISGNILKASVMFMLDKGASIHFAELMVFATHTHTHKEIYTFHFIYSKFQQCPRVFSVFFFFLLRWP